MTAQVDLCGVSMFLIALNTIFLISSVNKLSFLLRYLIRKITVIAIFILRREMSEVMQKLFA